MKCPRCKREVDKKKKVCVYCGARLDENKGIAQPQVLIPIGIGCVCILVILTAVLLMNPKNTAAGKLQDRLVKGNKYLSQADYKKAEVEFSEALKIDEQSPDAALGLAKVYNGQGKPKKALKMLQKSKDNLNEVTLAKVSDDADMWNDKSLEYERVFDTTQDLFTQQGNTKMAEETKKQKEVVVKIFVDNDVLPTPAPAEIVADKPESGDEITGSGNPAQEGEKKKKEENSQPYEESSEEAGIYSDSDRVDEEDSSEKKSVNGDQDEEPPVPAEEGDMAEEGDLEEPPVPAEEGNTEPVPAEEGDPEKQSVPAEEEDPAITPVPGEEDSLTVTPLPEWDILDEENPEEDTDPADPEIPGGAADPEEPESEDFPAPQDSISEEEFFPAEESTATEDQEPGAAEDQETIVPEDQETMSVPELSSDELLRAYASDTVLMQNSRASFDGTAQPYTYGGGSESLAALNGIVGMQLSDLNGDGESELLVINMRGGALSFDIYKVSDGMVVQTASGITAGRGFENAAEGADFHGIQTCFLTGSGVGIASEYVGTDTGDGNPSAQVSVTLFTIGSDGSAAQSVSASCTNGMDAESFISQMSSAGYDGSWIHESADVLASMDFADNPVQDLSAVPMSLTGGFAAVENGAQDMVMVSGSMPAGSAVLNMSLTDWTTLGI